MGETMGKTVPKFLKKTPATKRQARSKQLRKMVREEIARLRKFIKKLRQKMN